MPAPTPPWQQRHFIFKHAAVLTVIASILGVVASIPVSPTPKHQPPWVEKDWTHWNSTDVVEVLHSSPWGYFDPYDSGAYTVSSTYQLRSALPIRQALLRDLQLKNHYDKMSLQQKNSFDQQHAADIQETDDDPILYYAGHASRPDPVPTGELYPAVFPASEPPAFAVQLSDGTLVMPFQITVLHYDLSEKDYLFAFPREINGRCLVTPSDKNLIFAAGGPLPPIPIPKKHGPIRLGPMRREDFHPLSPRKNEKPFYPIASLKYKGKLEY